MDPRPRAFPGAAFRQVVELLVRENALFSGSLRLGDRVVQLARARGNVLIAMAERDNVVSGGGHRACAEPGGEASRRDVLRLPGGHVTFGDQEFAHNHTMPRLAEWITAHSDENLPETKDDDPDIRRIEPADRAALEAIPAQRSAEYRPQRS